MIIILIYYHAYFNKNGELYLQFCVSFHYLGVNTYQILQCRRFSSRENIAVSFLIGTLQLHFSFMKFVCTRHASTNKQLC